MTAWTAALQDSFEDGRLSRAERKALRALIAEELDSPASRARVRALAFEIAEGALKSSRPKGVLAWLEDVCALLAAPLPIPKVTSHADGEAWFSPGLDQLRGIQREIRATRRHLDICVFTITDDRLVRSIEEAVARRIRVRIVSDAEKSQDLGSDLAQLAKGGADVRLDRSPNHMHHKFALFDGARLLTGSYNWTRSAERGNSENVLVSEDPSLVTAYAAEFRRVWSLSDPA